MKELLFPNANKLSDLFESVATVYNISPDHYKSRIVHTWELDDDSFGGKGKAYLTSHCWVSNNNGRMMLDVTPKAALIEALGKSMLLSADYRIDFEIVGRVDETMLVTSRYDRIIGSRWLALLPASELDTLWSEHKGIEAIIELQAHVGIKEPEDKARAGWRSMSAHEKAQTLMAHQIVCGG